MLTKIANFDPENRILSMGLKSSNSPDLSVIISTYNSEDYLEKVIWSYSCQQFKNFEIIVADDGSGPDTKELIDNLKPKINFNIHHVWHADRGFQKTEILNKAILAANSSYLVFSDGDCLARNDFLEVHMNYREKGYFLSGGYHKLPMEVSRQVTKEDILNQNCFDVNWLKSKGMPSSFKNFKLTKSKKLSNFLNFITPTTATWNGHNSSGWKDDILKVNGFDERMKYGGEDRELGERLMNLGIKTKQIRYSAICVHLDHPRGYVNQEDIDKNNAIRKITREEKKTYTDHGISNRH